MDLKTREREKKHVSKDILRRGLRELGLERGNDVGVHSSLSSFGYVEGGAEAVIDALLEAVGAEGTIVMPTYSTNRRKLEIEPAERKAGIISKEEVLPYDPECTPCWTGKIPDTFWRRAEAVRGSHPTHSLAAIGPKRQGLCQGWDRLLEVQGKILLLGVTLGCCSSMHLAERDVPELTEYESKAPRAPERLRMLKEKYEAEGLRVLVQYPGQLCYPHFERMEGPCQEAGIMKIAVIGESTVKLLGLKELVDLYAQYLRKNPDMFYHD